MMDKFRSEQLIDDNVYNSITDSLEGTRYSEKQIGNVKGQNVITANIILVDTTVGQHNPKSLSWSYAFCKVAVKKLMGQEQNDLMRYMLYLQQKEWLETSGPYCRLLLEKCIAYEKYLPPLFHNRTLD
uniref:Uncharacterized protein n=1 Tax=Romanomermis culicivorax TaxID=13658 RepID=A0A915HXB4_ROMCU